LQGLKPALSLVFLARLNRLLKNSWDVNVRAELAFRPASKFFIFDPEPALAGGSNTVSRVFSAACKVVR
jgi:hypothetical protein